jgi:CheY-specific phosphatase CheX
MKSVVEIPQDVLYAALGQIMESMYYCEASAAGPGLLQSPAIGARVEFSGALSGEFKVVATRRLAMQLAADFLGTDPSEMTDSQAVAIVHELANVTCGATLSAWMPEAAFHYSVPSSLSAGELEAAWTHRFAVTDAETELAVDVCLHDKAPAAVSSH